MARPLKILHLGTYDHSLFGEELKLYDPKRPSHPSSWIRNLLAAYSKRYSQETEIHFLTFSANFQYDQTITHENIKFHFISAQSLKNLIGVGNERSTVWLDVLIKARNIIKDVNPDIVHAHGTESIFGM